MIYGHVESVVNRQDIPPSLIVRTRTSLGTSRVECIVGEHTRMTRGTERLSVGEIRPGEFVVATLRVHAGWLEAERIDIIKLKIDSAIAIREAETSTEGTDRRA
jgi:hypothetical protein